MAHELYLRLGVSKVASPEEIRKAYHKKALLSHSDRCSHLSSAEKEEKRKEFLEIKNAYDILSDPDKRFVYDRSGGKESANPSMPSAPSQPVPAAEFEKLLKSFFGPKSFAAQQRFSHPFFMHPSFFAAFSSTPRSNASQTPRGSYGTGEAETADLHYDLTLSPELAKKGGIRRIKILDREIVVQIPINASANLRLYIPGEGQKGVGGKSDGNLYLYCHIDRPQQTSFFSFSGISKLNIKPFLFYMMGALFALATIFYPFYSLIALAGILLTAGIIVLIPPLRERCLGYLEGNEDALLEGEMAFLPCEPCEPFSWRSGLRYRVSRELNRKTPEPSFSSNKRSSAYPSKGS